MEYIAFYISKSGIIQKKAGKKAFIAFQSAAKFKWGARLRCSDVWRGVSSREPWLVDTCVAESALESLRADEVLSVRQLAAA